MNWQESESTFTYNGNQVIRKKATIQQGELTATVYEAVNGKTFIEAPEIGHTDGGKPVLNNRKYLMPDYETGKVRAAEKLMGVFDRNENVK